MSESEEVKTIGYLLILLVDIKELPVPPTQSTKPFTLKFWSVCDETFAEKESRQSFFSHSSSVELFVVKNKLQRWNIRRSLLLWGLY
jgi:hypothetical protein